jgi:hypothetical protein
MVVAADRMGNASRKWSVLLVTRFVGVLIDNPNMQKASLGGAIFLSLFGLPFLVMGLVFASKMLDAARTGSQPGAVLGVVFGGFFVCIGLGLMALAVTSYRGARRQQAKVAAGPGSPWLWRDDWAAGRSNGKNIGGNVALWGFAIFWDAISFPAAALALPKAMAGNLVLLIVLIFPLVGIILTVAAALGTMRARRFGRTSFWFATLPFTPGGTLSGSIHLKMPITAVHGIDVRLSCVRRVTTSSGDNRTTVDTILWQEEQNIPNESLTRAYAEAHVPIHFTLPPDTYVTNTDNPNDKVLWILHAQADVPGVDFKDDYEVPVFRTKAASMVESASRWIDDGAHNRAAAAAAPAQVREEPVLPPVHTHIVITQEGTGTKVYFPPLRNPGQALGLFAFAVVWTAVVYLLYTHPAPWIFRILFGLAEVLIGIGLINVIFGSSSIRVFEGTLRVHKAILGIGKLTTIPIESVQSIDPVSVGQATASGEAKFGVFIQPANGPVVRVAANTLSRREARWIVATLNTACGRRDDAQPEFKPFMPSMPGQSGGGVVRIGRVSTNTVGRWIGFLFFAGWLFFVARMALHLFHR